MALVRGMDQSLIGGRILLDGVDIATVPLPLLRNSLRYLHVSIRWSLLATESFVVLASYLKNHSFGMRLFVNSVGLIINLPV